MRVLGCPAREDSLSLALTARQLPQRGSLKAERYQKPPSQREVAARRADGGSSLPHNTPYVGFTVPVPHSLMMMFSKAGRRAHTDT